MREHSRRRKSAGSGGCRGDSATGNLGLPRDSGSPRASTVISRERDRRRYSLMEGVPGERRAALLTEAAGSTLSTSLCSGGAFRAAGSVTGNLRGYAFSSSHGRQRRGGARRKASHLGSRKRPGSAWSAWSKLAHAVKRASLEVRIARFRPGWFGVGGPLKKREAAGLTTVDAGKPGSRLGLENRAARGCSSWKSVAEVGQGHLVSSSRRGSPDLEREGNPSSKGAEK